MNIKSFMKVFCICCVFCFTTTVKSESEIVYTNKNTILTAQDEYVRRSKMVDEYLEGLKYVVALSKSTRAFEHLVLLSRADTLFPFKGEFYLEKNDKGNDKNFRVMPVVVGVDSTIFDESIKDRYGVFDKNERLVIFSDRGGMDRLTRGLLSSHELEHVRRYLDGRKEYRFKKQEEVEVEMFEYKLMGKIGGRAYAKLLKKSLPIFAKRMKVNKDGSFDYPKFGNLPELETIFGVSSSPVVRDYIGSNFRDDLIFHYFDKFYPKRALEYKCAYLENRDK